MRSKLVPASIFAVLLAWLARLEAEAVECVGDRTYATAVADEGTSITGSLSISVGDPLTNIDGLSALTLVGSGALALALFARPAGEPRSTRA